MSCQRDNGIDDSLLFFFLILVMIFCKPGIIGCGCDSGCGCGDSCQAEC